MDKLFVFQKAAISATSVEEHSSGTNVDFFAVPSSSLVNISAIQNQVILYFKEANTFENSSASFAKVILNVTEGRERSTVLDVWAATHNENIDIIFIDNNRDPKPISNVLSIESINRYTTEKFPSGGGSSLPTGGVEDQVLTKLSATDGDADWEYPHTSVVIASTTTQARLNVNDNYYTGNDDYGWNYVIWIDPSSFSTSFTDHYAVMGIIIPKDITTLEFLSTIERSNGDGTGVTVELFTTNRPNGSTSNLTLTSIGSVSVGSTTGVVYNGDIALTGLSISKGTLLFVAIKKTGGTDITTYCRFNYTIIVS